MREQVKERPILFSAEMVRALLDGRKTQTRRVVKLPAFYRQRGPNLPREGMVVPLRADQWEPFRAGGSGCFLSGGSPAPDEQCIANVKGFVLGCPYGRVGERLWVRETWGESARNRIVFRASEDQWKPICEQEQWVSMPLWRPSIHMPRYASRITLEITHVRVQRLQEISDRDAIAEGIARDGGGWKSYTGGKNTSCVAYPSTSYSSLWDSLHGMHAWDRNPWVWALSFKRLQGERGAA